MVLLRGLVFCCMTDSTLCWRAFEHHLEAPRPPGLNLTFQRQLEVNFPTKQIVPPSQTGLSKRQTEKGSQWCSDSLQFMLHANIVLQAVTHLILGQSHCFHTETGRVCVQPRSALVVAAGKKEIND